MTNRELDAFIAEKCFGYLVIDLDEDGLYLDATVCQRQGAQFELPRYTTNMTDAWPVFEWLLENHIREDDIHFGPMLAMHSKGPCVITYQETFIADTFPLAICKAAVAAIEEIERLKVDSL